MHPKLAALAFLAACAWPLASLAAPQTTDFENTTVPNGFFSTFQQDGFNYVLTGGAPPTWTTHSGAPLVGTGIRAFSGGAGDAQQGSITRVGGGTFTMSSLIVANYGNTAALTVRAFNGATQVFTQSIAASASATVNFGNVVATEVRLNGNSANAGAEFGTTFGIDNFTIDVANVAPTLAGIEGNQVNYTQGGTAVVLDSGTALTVADADSADFNTGNLSLSIFSGSVAAEDVLEVGAVGPITLSGVDVVHSGTTIGSITSSGVGGNPLTITLNANATPARTQDLGRAIRYRNTNGSDPGVNLRRILWSLSDGDGAPARSYRSAVRVFPLIAGGSVVRVEFSGGTAPNPIFGNPKVFTAGGFTFRTGDQNNATNCDVGCFGSNFNAPNSPGAQIQANGLSGLTTTIRRSDNSTFTLVSLVVGNLSSANVTVTARNGASVLDTRVLAGGAAQQLAFANLTVDEVRLVGSTTITGNLVQGWIDDLVVAVANAPAAINNLAGNTATFTQLGSAVALDSGTAATVVDPDSANFDTGSLSVSITGNLWSAQDALGVGNIGSITTSGNTVLDAGTSIGTITANGSGGNPLTLTFNANATPARVQNLVRALNYNNTNTNTTTGVQGPDLGDRTLQVVLNDGDGAPPGSVTTTVQVRPAALTASTPVEVNFNGLNVVGTPSTLNFQNHTFTVAGGSQPYLSGGFATPSGPSLRAGATEIVNQTLTIRRTDNASFLLASLIVSNLSQEVGRTINTFNGASAVQSISLPARGTQRVVFNNSAVTRIEISGSTGLTTAGLAEVDDLAIFVPLPDLSIDNVTVSEGNSGTTNATFTVSLSGPAPTGGTQFNIATANGTAAAGSDYVAQSLTGQTIAAGSSSRTFTVLVNGDVSNEPNETFFVNVTSVIGATVVDGQGQGTISNDDPQPTLAIDSFSVTEGTGANTSAVFTVALSVPSGFAITANYTTANGSASQPADYTLTSGTLNFSPGQASQTISVPVIGDSSAEPDETFTVTLSALGNANPVGSTLIGTATIVDDDVFSDLSITKTDGQSSEDPGTPVSYSIVASNAGPDATSATVQDTLPATLTGATWSATAAGGATCPAPGSGSINANVTLPVGASCQFTLVATVSPAAIGALVNTATITNTGSSDPATGNNSATDSDTLRVIGVVVDTAGFNATRAEGAAASSYSVVLTSEPNAPVTITPSAASDVSITPPVLTFTAANWSTPQPIAVTAIDDTLVEATQAITITHAASGGVYAGVGVASVATSVTDNDSAVIAFVAGDDNVAEAAGSFSKNVVLSTTGNGVPGAGTLEAAYTVNLAYVAGTALQPQDFSPGPGSLVFPAGATSGNVQPVVVGIVADAIDEDAESLQMTLAGTATTAAITLGRASTTVTIDDDDTAGVIVTEGGGNTTVVEGGAGDSYSVVPASAPTATVTLSVTFDPAQVVVNGDSDGSFSTTFTAANWNTPQPLAVVAVDDTIVESNPHSTLLVQTLASADPRYAVINPADVNVSIGENDTQEIRFQTASSSFSEAVGTHTLTAQLVLVANGTPGGTIGADMTANVGLTLGSAEAGDLSLTTTSATFPAGSAHNSTLPVEVAIANDRTLETDETATLGLTLATSLGTVGGPHALTITDDETGSVTFAQPTSNAPEGTTPHSVNALLTVNGSGTGTAETEGAVSASLSDTPGSATTPADYTRITTSVTFAAGSASGSTQPVQSSIVDDALYEGNHGYTLAFTGITGGGALGASGTHAVTIVENDPLPVLSISSPSQSEGDSGSAPMNFVVTLTPASGLDTTFTRATADGSATLADGDYVAIAPGTLTIPAGQTGLTIAVVINGNTAYEGDETFGVQLSAVSNATPTSLVGTGTILDDDQQPTTTLITGDTPDPTVVGQPYTVSATVTAVTLSPLGSVTISDGSASCSAALVVGTAPASTMSCQLTSISAGAKTLTADYTPASTAFAASSDADTHLVNAAATTISVSGPPRSRINQPVSFTFVLGVSAPGAGTPTGTVTLSSGAASCTATLPATSCNLTFTALGARTVTASYAGDGNFNASTSSGAGNAQTLVYALSDLSITKSDGVGYYEPGDLLVYSVVVRNFGPDVAANIRVVDMIPSGLVNVVWSCDASGGGVCPVPGGAGNLDTTLASVPVGALLNFTFYGNVAGTPQQIANTASIELPIDTTVEDPVPGNNSATDTDLLDFSFRNGFEDPPVNAATGSYRLPVIALARSLGDDAQVVYTLDDTQGEALRVYARLLGNEIQYALATRGSHGLLGLGAWTTLAGEPTLNWEARAQARGWVLESARLQ